MKYLMCFFTVFNITLAAQTCDSIMIVWDGDSRLTNFFSEAVVSKAHRKLVAGGYIIDTANLAIPNAKMVEVLSRQANLFAKVRKGKRNVLVMMQGVNDFGQGYETVSSLSLKAMKYIADAKAAGYSDVFWINEYASDYQHESFAKYKYATFNPQRIAFNQMLSDSTAKYKFQVIDIASQSNFRDSANCSNTIVYLDRLHLTDKGNESFATFIYTKLNMALCQKIISGIPNVVDNVLHFYPNPATNEIFVTGEVSIYDIQGRFLLRGGAEKIDISHLPNGLYILKQSNQISKFVKQ